MGSVADKIARKVATQIRSNIIDLSGFRAAKELAREVGLDGERIKELVANGHDPCHAFYIVGQNLVSGFAEQISMMSEAKSYAKIVEKAEDEYAPDAPPISPLTRSYFTSWAFFDLQFGASRETIGTCILRVAEATGMPGWIADVVRPMQQSRMGFYLHVGMDGTKVLLKDIVTQEVRRRHSTSGYRGRTGELWYTCLMPPLHALADYHVVFTTPDIVLDGTEERFCRYIDRELGRMQTASRKRVDVEHLLKYGPSVNHWNEYIFLAYVNHQADAIFMAGIPDVRESLPQA